MADDKSNRGPGDGNRVARDQDYEFRYFATKFGLSIPQIRELFGKHGNDRETLYREARKLGNAVTTQERISNDDRTFHNQGRP
jgi:hypothetical protein